MNILFITYQIPSSRDPQSGSFNRSRILALSEKFNITLIVPIITTPVLRNFIPIPRLKKILFDIKQKKNSEIYSLGPNVEIKKFYWLKPPKFFWKLTIYLEKNKIEKVLKKNKINYDIILTSSLNHDSISIALINSLKNIPLFAIAEGSDVYNFLKYNKAKKKFFENILNKRKANVLAVSEGMKNYISSNFNFSNVYSINNGFDQSIFIFSSKYRKDKPILACAGRLEKVKGYDLLLKALSQLSCPFECIFIGKGVEEDNLKKLSSKLSLSNKVKFIGYKTHKELNEYYKNADLFIVPSLYESFCISALEAMATGLPIVGSDVDGIKNIVEINFNGLIFKNRDVNDLKNKILMALSMKWDYEAISFRAHSNYSWAKWKDDLITLYKKLENGK